MGALVVGELMGGVWVGASVVTGQSQGESQRGVANRDIRAERGREGRGGEEGLQESFVIEEGRNGTERSNISSRERSNIRQSEVGKGQISGKVK
eukprot:6191236-Pleurochrysis_carterae.AAC.1